jgi:DNA-binding NarL/FixJ family response regulator/tetratricopeptide (TPR) repeat protein
VIARPLSCRFFIGRHLEFDVLDQARRGLAKGRGSVVLIAGDAGIGKSRLVAEFLQKLRGGRLRNVASAECLERAPQPLGPFRVLAASLKHSLRAKDLPGDVVQTLAQLRVGAAAGAGSESEAAPLDKAELFAALATYFKAATAERATILTVEDLHWADPSTLDFLVYLAARIANSRLLLVATYRAEEAEADPLRGALARLAREPTVARLDLRALAGDELRALISGALDGQPSLPAKTLREVEARCEGNPFYAEELLKNAVEHRDAAEAPGLPLSIRTAIVERLAGLSDEDRAVVDRAAVLGQRFDPDVLARTLGSDVATLLPALRRAHKLNIIVEDEGERIQFRFRHALMRQAIYEEMLQIDARQLHAETLATLESLNEPSRDLEALAYHAWEAHDSAKALRYNEAAGEAALAVHGLAEARACFGRALEAAREPADQARLHERIGYVAQLQGLIHDALESFEAAFAIYRATDSFDRAADVVRAITSERNNLGDRSAPELGIKFLAEFGPRVNVQPRDALRALLARVLCIVYDFPRAREQLAAVADPESLVPRSRQNYVISWMDIAWFGGDSTTWSRYATELIDLVPALPPFLGLMALYSMVLTGTYLGQSRIIDRALALAGRIAAKRDFESMRVYGAAVRAMDAYYRGRLEQAREFMKDALSDTEAAVSQMAAALSAPLLAAALDDATLVPPAMEATIAEARRSASSPDDAAILAASAAWSVHRGALGSARADLRLALACRPRAVPYSGLPLVLAAEHLDLAETESFEPQLDGLEVPEAASVSSACAALAKAILARRRGDEQRAIALADTAAADFRALEWPLLEARALEAAERMDEAQRIYERCGASAKLTRPAPVSRHASDGEARGLSARERAVVELVARGLSNAAIAEQLSVSVKTVEKHVAAAFSKLHVRSRAQLAAVFTRDALSAEPPLSATRAQ